MEAILRDELVVLPVSSVLHGYRGVDGIALSVPSIVGRVGVSQVLDIELDEDERARFERSAAAVRASAEALALI